MNFEVSRRTFLGRSSVGLGALALGSLIESRTQAARPDLPHFPPTAKRVIRRRGPRTSTCSTTSR